MKLVKIALYSIAFSLIGCFGRPMTDEEIEQYGTKEFDATVGETFDATKGALASLNYEIVLENPEKGIIKTNRIPIKAQAKGELNTYGTNTTANYSEVVYYRQYIFKITATDSGAKVKATPKIFEADHDISGDSIWELEGDKGERKLWSTIFAEIEDNL